MADTRPSWDEYFMDITRRVATRSTCLRRAVGAILSSRQAHHRQRIQRRTFGACALPRYRLPAREARHSLRTAA